MRQRSAQTSRDFVERLIANVMTERRVDLGNIVDVDQDERERRARIRTQQFLDEAATRSELLGGAALDRSSWIGEEIRTIGLEGQVDWLGTRAGHAFDLQLTAAVYGWNDPAGAMIATHGFAFADRQTTLFGRSGEPRAADGTKNELFHEIDNRAGYYVGAQARYFDRAVLNILHYDNRADPAAFRPAVRDFAWETKFDSAALRIETGSSWTALVQWLGGQTFIAPGGMLLEWEFDSSSALLARRIGSHMLAAL